MTGNLWWRIVNVKVALRDGMFFLAVWLLLLVGGGSNFFRDPGSFWHVAVGLRLQSQGFFETDTYTYTFQGIDWIPHQWLGEWLMASAFGNGGFELLLLGATGILAGVFAALGRRLFQVGIHPLLVVLLVALGMAASAGQFHVRPHLATILGIFATTSLLAEADARRIPVDRLAWLIPICCIWSNLHGGVLAGLAIIALMFCGWMVLGFFNLGPVATRRDRVIACAILLACFSAIFVNPYGWKTPAAWFKIYSMQSLPQVINEHMPFGLNTAGWPWFVILALLYVSVMFSISPRKWRFTYIIPIVFGLLTLTRSRHAPLFAVSSLVLLAEILPSTTGRNWRRCVTPSHERSKFAVSAIIPVILIGLALMSTFGTVNKDPFMRYWVKLNQKAWPLEAVQAIREAARTFSRQPRVFCEYQFGSFLILYEPRCLVHIDDRCELFGDQFLADFANTRFELQTHRLEDPGFPLDRWQVQYGPMDLALVFTNGPFDSAFASRSDEWKILHRDDTATLYGRIVPIK